MQEIEAVGEKFYSGRFSRRFETLEKLEERIVKVLLRNDSRFKRFKLKC